MFIRRTFAAVVAVVALAVPAAAQAQQDLRSPDTRDAARAIAAPKQDLRSPDTRDAARAIAAPKQDLRSPDTVDAANGGIVDADTVGSIPPASKAAARTAAADGGSGVEWGAIALGLVLSVLVVVGAAMLMGRRAQRVGSTA